MINWYIKVNRLTREMRQKALDALELLKKEEESAAAVLNRYLKSDYEILYNLWEEKFPVSELGNLRRHIGFGEKHDYDDMLNSDIPLVEKKAEDHLLDSKKEKIEVGFEDLMHPTITEHAYQQYMNGHLRDAVLNAFIAVFDLIRERTGMDLDGDNLVTQVFSIQNPKLILSELDTASGRNDQTGFMQIFQGVYKGIRNSKAHSLQHNLTKEKAAQYLIFASILARRVSEAKIV